MNDILQDIQKLEEIKELCNGFSRSTIHSHIQDMINEKEKLVAEFEKTAPNHIQELCNNLKGDR